jgi:integrase
MSAGHSTQRTTPSTTRTKPAKPYPDFPLFAHAAGCWAKKIRGKLHYFGKWDNPDAALRQYLDQKDALHAGRKPRPDAERLTVKDSANAFLNAKQALLDAGELSPITFDGYKRTCDEIVAAFGKLRLVADLEPDDFANLRNRLSKKWGPVRLANTIQVVRSVFKHAYDSALIDRPVRFGPGFKRPTKKTIRLHKARQGPKLFAADEVRRLLGAAGVQLRAMIYLGINCAFGNADCGNLPLSALDLDAGMVNYPRPKTGVPRRCPLWPETVQAVRAALAERPAPKKAEHAGLAFVTSFGKSWSKDVADSPITKETRKLLDGLGINGRRNFYCLRHSWRTVADESKDQPAIDHIMGHESPHMASQYRERISDERLKAVVNHVRAWLFAPEPTVELPADEEGPQTLPLEQTA